MKIETRVTKINKEAENQHRFGRSGRHALISVSGNGMGIDQAIRKDIFHPFFTAKETGRGTGLRFSTVYGIAKQRNGLITLRNQPGKGSTFDIYLPQTRRRDPHRLFAGRGVEAHCHRQLDARSEIQENSLRQAGGDAPPEIRSGGKIILVAEDEPGVRSFLLEILRMEGYVVIEATDGEEAIRAFLENQDAIDLVILDEDMPRKSGMEVYEEIKEARAGTGVLLMSGYTEDIIFNKGVEDRVIEFISKPWSPEELLKKVGEMLAKT